MDNKLNHTTTFEETAEKRLPKYKASWYFTERDLYLEDIADQIVGLLADNGVSHVEWEQVSAYVRKAIEQQKIKHPDDSGRVQCI